MLVLIFSYKKEYIGWPTLLVKIAEILFCSQPHPQTLSHSRSLLSEAEQSSSPSRTGVGSDQEDSRTATMGNVKYISLFFFNLFTYLYMSLSDNMIR